jgi:hypothetical protein
VDPKAAKAIQEEISSDETLLWFDRPDTERTLLFALLASLAAAAASSVPPLHGSLWGFPALGLAGFIFLLGWLLNRHTFYGLTNRRAISVTPLFGTMSVNLVNRLGAPIAIRPGFLGQVTFGRGHLARATAHDDPTARLLFNYVADPNGVCEQARATQQRLLDEVDARANTRRAP